MKLTIKHQDRYSRGELLLRSFFGWIYIMLPHSFILLFVGIYGSILSFIAFLILLFTGRYPQSMFEFQVGLIKWRVRLSARMFNLSDGYPSFGINGSDDYTDVEIPYPEKLSRVKALLKFFFAWIYVMLPHLFLLIFRVYATFFMMFLAWWAVLFTGKFPESWHRFITGYIRWTFRLSLYYPLFMTDDYPPFTGKEIK